MDQKCIENPSIIPFGFYLLLSVYLLQSKRIAKEKRVMNWEKLFAKVMSNKGHGRRWKFLIETIKQKAKLG